VRSKKSVTVGVCVALQYLKRHLGVRIFRGRSSRVRPGVPGGPLFEPVFERPPQSGSPAGGPLGRLTTRFLSPHDMTADVRMSWCEVPPATHGRIPGGCSTATGADLGRRQRHLTWAIAAATGRTTDGRQGERHSGRHLEGRELISQAKYSCWYGRTAIPLLHP